MCLLDQSVDLCKDEIADQFKFFYEQLEEKRVKLLEQIDSIAKIKHSVIKLQIDRLKFYLNKDLINIQNDCINMILDESKRSKFDIFDRKQMSKYNTNRNINHTTSRMKYREYMIKDKINNILNKEPFMHADTQPKIAFRKTNDELNLLINSLRINTFDQIEAPVVKVSQITDRSFTVQWCFGNNNSNSTGGRSSLSASVINDLLSNRIISFTVEYFAIPGNNSNNINDLLYDNSNENSNSRVCIEYPNVIMLERLIDEHEHYNKNKNKNLNQDYSNHIFNFEIKNCKFDQLYSIRVRVESLLCVPRNDNNGSGINGDELENVKHFEFPGVWSDPCIILTLPLSCNIYNCHSSKNVKKIKKLLTKQPDPYYHYYPNRGGGNNNSNNSSKKSKNAAQNNNSSSSSNNVKFDVKGELTKFKTNKFDFVIKNRVFDQRFKFFKEIDKKLGMWDLDDDRLNATFNKLWQMGGNRKEKEKEKAKEKGKESKTSDEHKRPDESESDEDSDDTTSDDDESSEDSDDSDDSDDFTEKEQSKKHKQKKNLKEKLKKEALNYDCSFSVSPHAKKNMQKCPQKVKIHCCFDTLIDVASLASTSDECKNLFSVSYKMAEIGSKQSNSNWDFGFFSLRSIKLHLDLSKFYNIFIKKSKLNRKWFNKYQSRYDLYIPKNNRNNTTNSRQKGKKAAPASAGYTLNIEALQEKARGNVSCNGCELLSLIEEINQNVIDRLRESS